MGGERMREERRQRECFPSAFWLNILFLFEAALTANVSCFYLFFRLPCFYLYIYLYTYKYNNGLEYSR